MAQFVERERVELETRVRILVQAKIVSLPKIRLGGSVKTAPAGKGGVPGSTPGPGENFQHSNPNSR